jgi:hypothetical protein
MMNSAQRSKLAGPAQGCPAAEPVAGEVHLIPAQVDQLGSCTDMIDEEAAEQWRLNKAEQMLWLFEEDATKPPAKSSEGA